MLERIHERTYTDEEFADFITENRLIWEAQWWRDSMVVENLELKDEIKRLQALLAGGG